VANDIVSALLDMIRDRPLNRETLSLAQTMESVRASLTTPSGIRIVVDVVADLPLVNGDATQLRQVLLNLVDNAIHAASPTDEVRIAGRVDGAFVELAVEDTGRGVDPEVRRRLFEPLVTTKASGIGLGLALVKRIVNRHGGDISYAPRDGAGARFIVRLPFKEQA
jgi:signal transduction histidine kinase